MNFLPQEDKKSIKNQYRGRFLIALCFLIFILVIINLVLFLPSYFFLKVKNDGLKNQIEITSKNPDFKNLIEMENSLKNFSEKIKFFKSRDKETNSAPAILEEIVKAKSEISGSISITSFSYEKGADNSGAPLKKINILGNAGTREGFLLFLKNLKNNEKFLRVLSPPSNILKSMDIDYSLSIIIK